MNNNIPSSLKFLSLTLIIVLQIPCSIYANPMVLSSSNALQVPESFHVQVSYLSEYETGWPSDLSRGGQQLSPTWMGPTGITINSGSGLVSFQAMQFCDCNLSPGTYEYEILFPEGVSADARTTFTVEVTDPPPATPTDPIVEDVSDDEEVFPWEIPEPPWPKGINCVQHCETISQPEETPDEPTDVSPQQDTAPDTTSTTQKEEESGGCSTLSGRTPMEYFPVYLGLIAFSALYLRRRRS